MKKPLNKVAAAIWLVAAILAGGEILNVWRKESASESLSTVSVLATMSGSIMVIIVVVAILVAYGTIIELIDQIRWNAMPSDQRVTRRDRPSLWHRIMRGPDP